MKRSIFPYDRILSAVSTDGGVVWIKETGVRVDVGSNCQVYYPKVVSAENGWRMYYRAGGRRGFIASAFSNDGLNWSEEKGVRIGGDYKDGKFTRIEGCDVIQKLNGKLDMFFSAQEDDLWRIYRSESVDGLIWSAPKVCVDKSKNKESPNVKAPSVVLYRGLYRMFYTRFSPQDQSISTSVSIDGVTWDRCQKCTGIYSRTGHIYNPYAMETVDGSLRLYFTERLCFSDPQGAKIGSATSSDGVDWQREDGVRLEPGKEFDRHGIFNVDIVPIDSGHRMYYTGYWGRHWLEPLTLNYYRKIREKGNKES